MNNPYDLHSWSTQYRQVRLAEAWMTQLEGRLRENRKIRPGWDHLGLALAETLALLGAAGQPGVGMAKTW
jgi:hypothetical protein